MSIKEKSPGFLIDEFITAKFKLEENPDNYEIQLRVHDLANEVQVYMWKVQNLAEELHEVSKLCWDAQETVMELSGVDGWRHMTHIIAQAAIEAQQYNAKRNKLIRAIDKELNFEETVLEKTYGD